MHAIPPVTLRQFFLLSLTALLSVVLFWNLRDFLPALLGAYTMYVLLRRPLFYLTHQRKMPQLSAVVILLPLNALFQIVTTRILTPLQQSEDLATRIVQAVHTLEERIGWNFLSPDMLSKISNWGIQEISSLLSATFNGLLLLLIMYFILWFMLTEGANMETRFFRWLPLKQHNVVFVRNQTINLVYSNALGIPLMGIVQGLAGLIVYFFLGIEDIGLWFVATCLAGMIPFLGVALAYVPLSILLFSQGQVSQALLMVLYGVIVMGSVDNLARMWFLSKYGHTHPLKTLFGVIVGLRLFGFVGFIFGPILIALLLMLFQLYQNEFGSGHESLAMED
jgi:predicted PurR-regulated permease PerM